MKSDLLAPLALPVLLMMAQCSPVAPPLARGSAHFRTKVPPDPEPGTSCTDSYGGIGKGTNVPDLPNSATITNLGEMVVDGEHSEDNVPYEVSCKITGSGELRIEGEMAGTNTSPFLSSAGSSTYIEINGTIGTDGRGFGQVNFFTTATLAVSPKPDTSCTLAATPSPRKACSNSACVASAEEPVDYGSMVVTFDCPDMDMAAAGIAADCEADGTIVLDRCSY